MITRKTVDAEGRIDGLNEYADADVIVVRTPKPASGERADKVTKALEKPLAVLEDVWRYVSEHRDLTRRQVSDFTARYGNPAEKARAYAKNLTPEEFRTRVNELNNLVEKRLETISQDLEKRYDELEREVEQAVERVFGPAKEKATNGATPAREVDVKPVQDAAGKNASPSTKKPTDGKSSKKTGA